MGEVYEARDTKIGRKVAIKVIPEDYRHDRKRLIRFETEAQAAGALNHPNLLVVHDVGTYEGVPFLVTELLDGETLGKRIGRSKLSIRMAIDFASQIASGLAAAHDAGIVHRDLKPENLFITNGERIKILDFGIAKVVPSRDESGLPPGLPTKMDTSGMILGTVGYMSPEQVRVGGDKVDHRSDIFSLGVVLYEMIAGRGAFNKDTAVETMAAILNEEPPELSEAVRTANPILTRLLFRCLEKDPSHRFQSMRDLAFEFDVLRELPESSRGVVKPKVSALKWLPLPILGVALLAAVVGFLTGKKTALVPQASYTQITYRRGSINAAKYAPDGHTIVYSAAWDGKPSEIFVTRSEKPESNSLGLPNARVLAVSSSGELAVLLQPVYLGQFTSRGTLARVPIVGGTPRNILDNVQDADWSGDGSNLAIVRNVEGINRLEYPIGKVLYETSGWIGSPRISPRGDMIAFLDHQVQWDNRGWVAVVDLSGKSKRLTREWSSEDGLAWSVSGDEVLFSAKVAGEASELHAVKVSGGEREVVRTPANLVLHDISRGGQLLLSAGNDSTEFMGLGPGDTKERNLSWLDRGAVRDLSPDGRVFVFTHWGVGSGPNYAGYLEKMDGSPGVRLGDGGVWALSPNQQWVLASLYEPSELILLPVGSGETRHLKRGAIEYYGFGAAWYPNGNQVLFIGKETGKVMRTFAQDINGGDPHPITPEGITGDVISPDGKFLVAADQRGRRFLYPLNGGGDELRIQGLRDDDQIARWDIDGRALFVYQNGESELKLYRINPFDGRRDLIKSISPRDPAGQVGPLRLFVTPDGKWYVYTFGRYLSSLYLVDGLL